MSRFAEHLCDVLNRAGYGYTSDHVQCHLTQVDEDTVRKIVAEEVAKLLPQPKAEPVEPIAAEPPVEVKPEVAAEPVKAEGA